MTSKNQLQSKIQELEAELQEFKQQLGSYKEITIETASVGDVLEDGSIVLQKSNGLALLVAPKVTEVEATWSKEFAEVFQKLKEQGFNPSQWSVPTKEQLILAYETIPNEFSTTKYWSSTYLGNGYACFVRFYSFWQFLQSFWQFLQLNKTGAFYVRAFRCVTY
jgi:hypothetical protein